MGRLSQMCVDAVFIFSVFICIGTVFQIPKNIRTMQRLRAQGAPLKEIFLEIGVTLAFWIFTIFFIWFCLDIDRFGMFN